MASKTQKAIGFVDDSGDPGFGFNTGSTRFFVVSLIVFRDTLEAEKLAVAVKEMKRKTKLADHAELKFNSSSEKIKRELFTILNNFEYEIYAIVVDKNKVYSPELQNKKDSFYKYFIKELLQKKSGNFEHLKIKIDGSGNKEFKKSFSSYLRREAKNSCGHLEISFVDSKENILIQCADMISGSLRVSYEKTDSRYADLFNKLKKPKRDIWEFK